MNTTERAALAAIAILAYQAVTEGERADPISDSTIADLLSDLRHYCHTYDIDWTYVDERAREHFNAEIEREGR